MPVCYLRGAEYNLAVIPVVLKKVLWTEKRQKIWQLLTEDESSKILTHFYGCLAITFLRTLFDWIFEIMKAGI